MESIVNVIDRYEYVPKVENNNKFEQHKEECIIKLDKHLRYRDKLDKSAIYLEDHRDRELIISNSKKVRDCVYTLKKEYGY